MAEEKACKSPQNTEGARRLKAYFAKKRDEMEKYHRVLTALKGLDPKDVMDDFWGDEIVEDCGQAVDDYVIYRYRVWRDKIVLEDYFRPRGSVESVELSCLTIEGMDEIVELINALNVSIDDPDEITFKLWQALVDYAIGHNFESCYDFSAPLCKLGIGHKYKRLNDGLGGFEL